MTQITVTRQADGIFRVQSPAGTSHDVSVPAEFPASLGCGHVAPGELVRASFEFLLEHEPASSILRQFSLDIISQYFPGYPAEIRARLSGGSLGITGRTFFNADFQPEGVIVVSALPGGPADRGGIMLGDIIVNVSETPITTLSSLITALASLSPGARMEIGLVRDGVHVTVEVPLGEGLSI